MECPDCKTPMRNIGILSVKQKNESKSKTVTNFHCPDCGYRIRKERENYHE